VGGVVCSASYLDDRGRHAGARLERLEFRKLRRRQQCDGCVFVKGCLGRADGRGDDEKERERAGGGR